MFNGDITYIMGLDSYLSYDYKLIVNEYNDISKINKRFSLPYNLKFTSLISLGFREREREQS